MSFFRWLINTWKGRAVLTLIVLLVAVRIALPSLVLNYVNDTLDNIPGYQGRIADIDIHLWRGAYKIQNIELVKTDSPVPKPLFAADTIDLSVLWSALFRGAVVAEVYMTKPQVNFVAGKKGQEAQTGEDKEWTEVAQELVPINIDRFQAVNGSIHYYDFNSDPQVDVYINNVDAVLRNLNNSRGKGKERLAKLKVHALAMNHADVNLNLNIDPFAAKPDFNFDFRLLHLQMTRIREYLKAYAPFDANSGTLDLVVEMAAKDGAVDGYIKPILKNLDILSWNKDVEQDEDNPFRVILEATSGFFTDLLQNQPKDQFATRVPISGRLDDPSVGVLPAIGNILKNGFVKAFRPTLEHSVTPPK
ncbi:DUF748 domain-containing protein [Nitrococcus mobilis]|uniref:DUF748 domain-containing protein n=1 Tax=Nitrococcus mobilis Nb-231 TaxID=314278 RepID=A4BMA2_9GAMM|nr:DUF748 domain-containing protein [Nitrococcus mobilis]EAR23440.1 hypothetical protein NB231_16508 [Nitrococcus mobilis Nb-231]